MVPNAGPGAPDLRLWYNIGQQRKKCKKSSLPEIREGIHMAKLLAILLVFVGTALGQMTNVTISDNDGNRAIGTIYNGNVFFIDNNGNAVHGTIRDGNIFLTH